MASILILMRMRNAKSRLSHLLDKPARERLCALMFSCVLSSISDFPTYVLSPTRLKGNFTWIEDNCEGINRAVQKAIDTISDDLLILPSDIPAITEEDVKTIILQKENLVFVPARDGGTNALFIKEGIPFTTHYGPKSFLLHLREAEERGLRYSVLRMENLRDVDTEDDLVWFSMKARGEMKRFVSSLFAKPKP